MIDFLTAAYTDIGIKKKVNQDSVCSEVVETDEGQILIAAVCDGMGGLSDGEKASSTMVNNLLEWFEDVFLCGEGFPSFEFFTENIDDLIDDVNDQIANASQDASGTTASILIAGAGKYYIANVGDSRVYICKDGRLRQITKDQSFVQEQIDKGLLTAEEAKHHPKRNMLLQCVGASDIVLPDHYEGTYRQGDWFLLCSDGFHHEISPDEMKDVISRSLGSIEGALCSLTEMCKDRGEKDNISSVVVKTAEPRRFW